MPRSAGPLLSGLAVAIAALGVPLAPLAGQFGEAAASEGTGTGTFHALLIGVQNYPNAPDLATLRHPINDARRLRDILVSRYDFDSLNITLLEDPDGDAILDAFIALRGLQPNDNLLVFFAGHGHFDETARMGYWMPSDALPNDERRRSWLSNADIAGQLIKIRAHHILLITDACFSGSMFLPSPVEASGFQADQEARLARSSRRAITSGSLNTVPDASPFLKFLLNTLANNTASPLPAARLYSMVVTTLTRTTLGRELPTPVLGVLPNTGDAGGDFPFVLQPEEAATKANREREYAEGPRRIFQHILVRVGGTTAEDSARARTRITGVRLALTLGMDFGEAARRFSDDTLSAGERGFLPPERKLSSARNEFERVGGGLAVGATSDPVPTRGGLHLIRRPTLAELDDYDATFLPSEEGGREAMNRRYDFLRLREQHLQAIITGQPAPSDLVEPKRAIDAVERINAENFTSALRQGEMAFLEGRLADAAAAYRSILAAARKDGTDERDLTLLQADLGLIQLHQADSASGAAARDLAHAAMTTLKEVIAARGVPALEVAELYRRARTLAGGGATSPSATPPARPATASGGGARPK